MVSLIYKFTSGSYNQTTHPRSGDSQIQETLLARSAEKPSSNYDRECSNQYPYLSTPIPKGLSRSKMKWWAIHKNLPADVIVRRPHPRSEDSQKQETLLARSAEKPTCNYDIECSKHRSSLSTLRPKWLSRSNIKWWDIHINFPVDVIVRLPHPRNGKRQGQKTFLASSPNKQSRNYDIECSKHHPSLSTTRPKGLSRSKMKWRDLYKNLPVDVIVRLPHPRIEKSQGHETFLAPSADKKTRKNDIECSNHHPSLSNLTPKELSRSKMKWWALYTNLPVDVIIRLPHPRSGDSQIQETFLARSA